MNWTLMDSFVGVVPGVSSAMTTRRVIDRVAGASNDPPVLAPCHAWMTLSGGMSSRKWWGNDH